MGFYICVQHVQSYYFRCKSFVYFFLVVYVLFVVASYISYFGLKFYYLKKYETRVEIYNNCIFTKKKIKT